MKVLHINSYFSSSKFYKSLYDKQMENELDINVFVPVSSPSKEANGNMGNYTIVSANHNKFDRLLFHLKHYKIYKDIIRKYKVERFSIIHAHSLFSNGFIAMRLKQEYGIPYVVAVRNTDVNLFFKKMLHLRRLGIQILKEAERIVFLSKTYRDSVIEEYIPNNLKEEMYKKTSIIPNGISNYWLENIGPKKEIQENRSLNLLHVGVIDKNKNITTTVKAIELLQNKGYNVKFTVVGGIKDENVFNQIKDLSYINYIPKTSQELLIDVYRDNDIFVMPSITETFGLVYAEAMSQGLPVIYSKGQGFDRQFKEGEVGYSVPSESAEDITNRIIDIIDNYEFLTKNCIEKVNKFNWDRITEEYIQLYNHLIV
ncbi:glycosyltransferase family 4 protein [Bacillus cereus group sp. BfR-BA-01423]|uniref:glycosyltransferase family 4 protein n=1 Tax=Bacillus cereus group sp. BfR-BA-01423 TaxID=2920340 RepID=UPI001F590A00|nr:glycosyltransferase family 4 protein [Bacillus cereus group sp. BfR-BA-01423]